RGPTTFYRVERNSEAVARSRPVVARNSWLVARFHEGVARIAQSPIFPIPPQNYRSNHNHGNLKFPNNKNGVIPIRHNTVYLIPLIWILILQKTKADLPEMPDSAQLKFSG